MTLVDTSGAIEVPRGTKSEVAHQILDHVVAMRAAAAKPPAPKAKTKRKLTRPSTPAYGPGQEGTMGFFGDLKNKVTGGAAKLNISVPSVRRGQASPVRIEATAKGNGKVAQVYLIVRAIETCEVKDSDWDGNRHTTETVRGRKISYENKITVAGAFELKSGETYSWDAQLELPTNTNPTFNGKIIGHVWEVQAGLDMPGNDPDSGWVKFEVQ